MASGVDSVETLRRFRRVAHGSGRGFFVIATRRRVPAVRATAWISLLLAVTVLSCTRAPRLSRDSDLITSLRAEYLQNNANSAFAPHVMRGEVVKGMNEMEVLASWGLPNMRRGSQGSGTESWTYYARDPDTHQLASYELVFVERLVSRWVIDGNAPGLRTLTPKDLVGIPTIGENPGGSALDGSNANGGSLKKRP